MNNLKIAVVILHYLTDEDTIKCIESIFNTAKFNQVDIVVVDNNSNNGSIEKVEEYIKNNNRENVHIIKNTENLGFAKGNNIGYQYCKNNLKSNCIIISNNDIIFNSNNFEQRINNDIKEYNAGVIGPDIISMVDGGHQNPMEDNNQSRRDIIFEIIRYRMLYILSYIYIYPIMKRIGGNKKQTNVIQTKKQEITTNIQLHGAFLIFCPEFVERNDNAFNNDTFLYLEETILKKMCEKQRIKTCYDPEIVVLHKEDSSTNKLLKNNSRRKRLFVFKNLIKSHKILLKYCNNEKKLSNKKHGKEC